jgi:hypothetical protein
MSKQVDLVSSKTGRTYRIGGCKTSGKPSTLPEFSTSAKYMEKELPPSVDLRPFMTPAENQTDSGSWLVH